MKELIESAWSNRELLKEEQTRKTILTVIEELDKGRIRVAEPTSDGWKVNECRDAPIGEPGKPVDQFLVLGNCIVARRLDLIDARQREWCRECHGRVLCARVHFSYP